MFQTLNRTAKFNAAARKLGFLTTIEFLTAFQQYSGVAPNTVYKWNTGRLYLLDPEENPTEGVEQFMMFTGMMLNELFDEDIIEQSVKRSLYRCPIERASYQIHCQERINADLLEERDRTKSIEDALALLTPRQAKVVRERFGLDGDVYTLEEIGNDLEVGKERVRQIEATALRKLRHPMRSDPLREFF